MTTEDQSGAASRDRHSIIHGYLATGGAFLGGLAALLTVLLPYWAR